MKRFVRAFSALSALAVLISLFGDSPLYAQTSAPSTLNVIPASPLRTQRLTRQVLGLIHDAHETLVHPTQADLTRADINHAITAVSLEIATLPTLERNRLILGMLGEFAQNPDSRLPLQALLEAVDTRLRAKMDSAPPADGAGAVFDRVLVVTTLVATAVFARRLVINLRTYITPAAIRTALTESRAILGTRSAIGGSVGAGLVLSMETDAAFRTFETVPLLPIDVLEITQHEIALNYAHDAALQLTSADFWLDPVTHKKRIMPKNLRQAWSARLAQIEVWKHEIEDLKTMAPGEESTLQNALDDFGKVEEIRTLIKN